MAKGKSTSCRAVQQRLFFAPAVVGLFTDTQLTGSLANGLALGDENLCLPEMTDDLFCGITFSCHDDPFLMTQFLTIGLGTFQGVRSVTHRSYVRSKPHIAFSVFKDVADRARQVELRPSPGFGELLGLGFDGERVHGEGRDRQQEAEKTEDRGRKADGYSK